MQFPELDNFFLASAGAGAALVGLLFVAVSISPESTVASKAPVERQVIATSAYTAFINAFFVSLGAFLPGSLAVVALILATVSLVSSLNLIRLVLKQQRGWLNLLRRAVVLAESFLLYGYEFYFAWQILSSPPAQKVFYAHTLAALILGSYGVGITRSWQLLGAPRSGLFGWLSPLRDLDQTKPKAASSQAGEDSTQAVQTRSSGTPGGDS